jgi:hypothetical protein
LNGHWTLQGDVAYQRSQPLNSLVVAVQLHFNFVGRNTLFSTALSPSMVP